MPKNTWWIASLLLSLFALGGGAYYVKQQQAEIAQARADMEAIRKSAEETGAHADRLLKGLEESKEQIERLMREKDEATQAQKNLETQMRSALESKDVTISELQGRLTVNILDRILFDSGEVVVKPEGQAVLDQVAKVLANYPKRQIQVIGHTDNVPIRFNPKNPFHTNWELSVGRAIAAVRYLSEKAGVDAKRLGAVGYGEFHPIADNATAEGRAKNRRIALVVMPEEIVPNDINVAALVTNLVSAATNSAVVATNSGVSTNAVGLTNGVNGASKPNAADSAEKKSE
jgi:chemotaxis protein MotB